MIPSHGSSTSGQTDQAAGMRQGLQQPEWPVWGGRVKGDVSEPVGRTLNSKTGNVLLDLLRGGRSAPRR